jgi:hypothetical protein
MLKAIAIATPPSVHSVPSSFTQLDNDFHTIISVPASSEKASAKMGVAGANDATKDGVVK